MKANELKATDLMVGDWVICYHPSRQQSFERVSVGLLHTLDQQEHGHIKEDSPLFRIVQPIPLTPEILGKNFDLLYEKKCIYIYSGIKGRFIIQNHYRAKWWSWSLDYDEQTGTASAFGGVNYIHELQHYLIGNKIDKEIVV